MILRRCAITTVRLRGRQHHHRSVLAIVVSIVIAALLPAAVHFYEYFVSLLLPHDKPGTTDGGVRTARSPQRGLGKVRRLRGFRRAARVSTCVGATEF